MLNALFVTHGRILVRRAGPWLCRIFTAITVYLVKMLGGGVVRLEFVVADGPGRRDSAVMTNLAEVFFAQTKESSAVKLSVATDEIIRVRMQLLAVTVAPRLFGVVSRLEVYGARAPVVLFTRNVIAALEQQNLLARGRKFVGQRAAARARADDDYVVMVVAGHDDTPSDSYYMFIDCIAAVIKGINGAVPKFTLKRLHQMVTAQYFARSAFAGNS